MQHIDVELAVEITPVVTPVVARAREVRAGLAAVHANAVVSQPLDQHRVHPAAGQANLAGEPLGGLVELADVVLTLVEEVPDLLVRHRRRRGPRRFRPAGAGERGEALVGLAVAAVQRDQRMGGLRELLGELGGVGGRHLQADRAVGEDLLDLRDQPGHVVRGEEAGVDAECLGDA